MDHTGISFSLDAPRAVYITSVAILGIRSPLEAERGGGGVAGLTSTSTRCLVKVVSWSCLTSHNVAPMLFYRP